MQYQAVAFDPPATRSGPAETAANALDQLVNSYAVDGWEFMGVQNHSTVVPGSNGCFGIGATSPYPMTVSIAVFRR